nr:hypothetical protein CFP56_13667 [Quercus suber]
MKTFRSLCCVEIDRRCPSMFSEVLDTLLAVDFHLMGTIHSFLVLFLVCLLGFLFQCPRMRFLSFQCSP